MKRRRLLLFVAFVLLTIAAKAQISTCSYYDGYWSNWKSHTRKYYTMPSTYEYQLYGNYHGFIIYKRSVHPSEYFFKFQINGYWEPDKKERKKHLKNNEWYEYSGIVEYYVTEEYPTIYEVLKKYNFPCFNVNSGSVGNPCVKRTTSATIKIAPYKKRPKCYNIYFDGVGVAIDLENTYWK